MSFLDSIFAKKVHEGPCKYAVNKGLKKAPSVALQSALEVIQKNPDRVDLRGKCLPSYLYTQNASFMEGELKMCRKALFQSLPEAKRVELTCVDGVKVDGFYLPGTVSKAVLFLHGNGGFYETCSDQALDVKEMLAEDVHLFMFNPRGTGQSDGVPLGRNLSLDVMSAFLFLVDKIGISPSHILIYGHSMGGCIGAIGAELLQQLYPDETIHLVSDRSFSSMTDHLDAFSRRTDEPGFLARGVPRAQSLDGWQMDAIGAIKSLRGRVCVIYHPEDEIIIKEASIAYHLQSQKLLPSPQFHALELDRDHAQGERNHNRFLFEKEREAFRKIWDSVF